MKLKSLATILMVAVALVAANCGSKEVKEAPKTPDMPKVETDMGGTIADGINRTLDAVGANEATGFAFGATTISASKLKEWDSKSLKNPLTGKVEVVPGSEEIKSKAIKEAASKVPEGYVLEITGHTDIVGGAGPNKAFSVSRARGFQSQLKKMGVDISKTRVAGAGLTQLKNAADGKADENRRVTLKVVKK
ncbi:MAG: OmpA family protein [Leptospiraceae bacterium]|nr:OmpA family protein [Leptospiraceae bacterium]